jgi:hypothetical protein
MKMRCYSKTMVLLGVAMSLGFTPMALGQAAPTPPPSPPSDQAASIQLSADVWDVVRLAHSHVDDATILEFIKNSGKAYSLGVNEILYLREQGLSDQVIAAMLHHSSPAIAPAVQPTQPPVWESTPPQTVYQTAPTAVPQAQVQAAPAVVQSAPVYTTPAPVYAYPSYPAYSYPYYGSYGWPAISFSFGWGGYGYYGGHYHGGYYGYHGGGYHGGGYHGGGHH